MKHDTSIKRKLAAIFFLDVVGYSALAHADEARALGLLDEVRTLLRAALAAHQGRLIKELGDGFLAEFPSALAAVDCAVALQETFHRRNQTAPDNRQIRVRVGVHLGDVEHREGDVLGNGVNIAQRVETLAGPGEICLTLSVANQIRSRYGERLVAMGTRSLKHIPEPVEVFLIPGAGRSLRAARFRERLRRCCPFLIAALVVCLGVAVALLWREAPWRHGKSGIQLVVLPFDTAAGDAEMKSYGDGLAETLCSKLTQLGQFQAKLQVVPMSEVRRAGVLTASDAERAFRATRAISGRLQRSGDVVRLTLNLIDAARRIQLRSADWTNVLAAAFQLQDTAAEQAAAMLGLAVSDEARARLQAGGTRDATANELYLRAVGKLERYDRVENEDAALADLQSALNRDSGFALAQASLADALLRKFDLVRQPELVSNAMACAQRAVALSPNLPKAHAALGLAYLNSGDCDAAIRELEQSLALNPADPQAYNRLAKARLACGQTGAAEQTFLAAIQARPDYWGGYNDLGKFYYETAQYSRAEKAFRQALERTPDNSLVHANLGGLYYLMGRYADAKTELRRSLDLNPNPQAFSNLGTVLFFEGDYAGAVKMFRKVLELGSDDPIYWLNLADARRLAGEPAADCRADYRKAADLASHLLDLNPRNWEQRGIYALSLAGLGDFPAALAQIAQARQEAPKDAQTAFFAALIHEQAGERVPALKALNDALDFGYPRHEALRHPDLKAVRLDTRFSPVENPIRLPEPK